MCVFIYTYMFTCTVVCMRRSENGFQESILSFHLLFVTRSFLFKLSGYELARNSVSNFAVELLALQMYVSTFGFLRGFKLKSSDFHNNHFYLPNRVPSTTVTAYQGHQDNK